MPCGCFSRAALGHGGEPLGEETCQQVIERIYPTPHFGQDRVTLVETSPHPTTSLRSFWSHREHRQT